MELQNLEVEMNRLKDLENTILYMEVVITALVMLLGGEVEIDFSRMEQELKKNTTTSFVNVDSVVYKVVNREELNARIKKRKDI